MAAWTDRVLNVLRLARRGVLLLVDHARDDHLWTLVRALRAEHPNATVINALTKIESLPDGAVAVVVPLAQEADSLNLARPIFERKSLRVVLWCAAPVTVALAENAADLFSWVSARVECQQGVPWFTAATLRAAHDADIAGVFWKGPGAPDDALTAAGLRVSQRIGAGRTAREIAEALRATEPEAWLWVDDVDSDERMITLRLVLADGKRRGRVIASAMRATKTGWWSPHRFNARAPEVLFDDARTLGGWTLLDDQVDALRSLPPEIDVELAVHVRGEPGAARVAQDRLDAGDDREALLRALGGAQDPGLMLAAKAMDDTDLNDAITYEPPLGAPSWALDLGPTFMLRETWKNPRCIEARVELRSAYGLGDPLDGDGNDGTIWDHWWASRPIDANPRVEVIHGISGLSYLSEVLLWIENDAGLSRALSWDIEAVRALLFRDVPHGIEAASRLIAAARYVEAATLLEHTARDSADLRQQALARFELAMIPDRRDLAAAEAALHELVSRLPSGHWRLQDARERLQFARALP